MFRGFAPYINTSGRTIKDIIAKVEIIGNEKIYELGCGGAGFLQLMSRKYPKTTLVGVEYAFLPWFVANIQIKIQKIKNITIIRQNIFKIDLKEANIIYCYLNPKTMALLKEKFKKECGPNTQIISYRFPINGWDPKSIIETNGDKVYLYKN